MKEAISINDLSYRYPDGHQALTGISLHIISGEKVALIGPNGAGKSTLLLHLNGILSGIGNIKIMGLEPTRENLPIIRALIGLVFQNPDDQLFSPTVFEDVAYGPIYQGLDKATVQSRVNQALDDVHMQEYQERVSHHLSLGEKKRIAIATVLSMQPEILVLDEPSSGLDPRARRELIQLLRELPQTLLIATHDLLLVRELLPRTIVIDGGRIAADGDTIEILTDSTRLESHGLELPK
ncbi:MAG: ATP-binding cassette domain-containing protein [Anaerolineaceae bacterium]